MSVATVLNAQWKFLKLFLPVLLLLLATLGKPFVTILFAGRIGKNHLDGIGLANTVYNVVVVSLVAGYSTVFDTYGPQVYGSTQKRELGTVALKCAAQGGLLYLFVLGPYLNLVYLIDVLPGDNSLGNNATLGNTGSGDYAELEVENSFQDIAIKYLRMICGCGYMTFLINIIVRYFAIQGHTKSMYLIAVSDFAVHVLLNYVLVEVKDMGADGLGIATNGSSMFALALSVGICYAMRKRNDLAWSGFSMKVLENWVPMLKLGLSGIVNLLAEMALFEMAIFMSQFDGTTALSTVLIQFQMTSILLSVAIGVSYASSILIGNSLGEGDPKMVKLYMRMTVVNTLVESVPLGLLAYGLRSYLVEIFSNDMEIIEMFSNTFWLCCVLVPFDHLQGNLSRGILVSFGKQRFIAIAMSVICYGVALPIVVLTVLFTDLKIYGIYIGIFSFVLLNSLAVVTRILKLNIPQEIEKTKVRVGEKESEEETQLGMIDPMYEESSMEETDSSGIENTISRGIQKEAKWIIVAFFGALLSFLIFSTVSVMK